MEYTQKASEIFKPKVNLNQNTLLLTRETTLLAGIRFDHIASKKRVNLWLLDSLGDWVNVREIKLAECIALDGLAADALEYIVMGRNTISNENALRAYFPGSVVRWTKDGSSAFLLLNTDSKALGGFYFKREKGNKVILTLYLDTLKGWKTIREVSKEELVVIRCLARDAIDFLRKNVEEE